jgi:hypothetical protein
MVAGHYDSACRFVFQDVSERLRSDATIDKIGVLQLPYFLVDMSGG